ncbi:MAG: hypothetical protein DMG39_12550 [Acidobacteria bacterium]|nr:MAG: hypothetical protein DMG39_12550 [Acidobacteriota bacterium]
MSSDKVPAQFAPGVLPSAQWIRRRRNPCSQAERVQQPVIRQRFDEALIAFQLIEEDSRPQPHLG